MLNILAAVEAKEVATIVTTSSAATVAAVLGILKFVKKKGPQRLVIEAITEKIPKEYELRMENVEADIVTIQSQQAASALIAGQRYDTLNDKLSATASSIARIEGHLLGNKEH